VSGTRRKPGRLGPYVDGYRTRLLELGYSPLSVTHSLTALGHLGRWMAREDFDVDRLDADAVRAFLAAYVRDRGRLPTAGVWPLLDYLRREGVVAPQSAAPGTVLDVLFVDYRAWLLRERALAPATVRGHVGLAHGFLAQRISPDGTLDLTRLTGADVTEFLLRECTRVKPGSAGCYASRLRSLRTLGLEPDFVAVRDGQPVTVLDAKFKRLEHDLGGDAYQLLAYLLEFGPRTGLLVSATGSRSDRRVRAVDKLLGVRPLGLDQPPDRVLARIDELADEAIEGDRQRECATYPCGGVLSPRAIARNTASVPAHTASV
jgi:hypothetical protein